MIQKVQISNFQSIKELELDLSRFTVIVGPSNSGKSAFLRALKVLFRNSSGSSFVTHGQKNAKVAVNIDGENAHIVKGGGLNTYYYDDGDKDEFKTWTKCGTTVPDYISEFFRVNDLTFAEQFDRPFLLDETGSAVARVIGELTNADRLMAAVSEANRRQREASSKLKDGQARLSTTIATLEQYRSLPVKLAALEEVKDMFKTKALLTDKLKLLHNFKQRIDEAIINIVEPKSTDIPNFVVLDDLKSRFDLLVALNKKFKEAVYDKEMSEKVSTHSKTFYEDSLKEFNTVLQEVGVCPLCQQSVLTKT